MVVTPRGKDPQVGRITLAGRIGVPGQKRYDGDPFGDDHRIVITHDLNGVDGGGVRGIGHGGLLDDPASNGDGTTHARAKPEPLLVAAIIGCPYMGRDAVVRCEATP